MQAACWLLVASTVLSAACATRNARLMSFREYGAALHSFPTVLRLQGRTGTLLYYGVAHTSDPANPQVEEIQRLWTEFQPTAAFNEGGAPPVLETLEETVGRYGESALVRWLARRDGVTVQTFEPSRAEVVAALAPHFAPEQYKVALVLRGLAENSRRAEQFRIADIDAEVDRVLAILSRTPGLEGAPTTAADFAARATRLVPVDADWRRPDPAWFDPVPEPPATWMNAFAKAENEFRDRVIIRTLADTVRAGERVFAVIGGTHVVMQERALRDLLSR